MDFFPTNMQPFTSQDVSCELVERLFLQQQLTVDDLQNTLEINVWAIKMNLHCRWSTGEKVM